MPTASSKACLFLFSAYLQINNKTNVVTSPKENIPTPALVYLKSSFSCYLEVFDCLLFVLPSFFAFSCIYSVCFLKTGFGKTFCLNYASFFFCEEVHWSVFINIKSYMEAGCSRVIAFVTVVEFFACCARK